MRILIITDSLGCPREEIKVEDTWVDKILAEYRAEANIYTHCYHGMQSRQYYKPYIKEINPDIIITEIGIVDAVRRAQSYYGGQIVSRLPLINKVVHRLMKKYHYFFTKIRDIHSSSIEDYKNLYKYALQNTSAKILFIPIAPPGEKLIRMTYNVKKDISIYNKSITSLDDNRIDEVNCFCKNDIDEYLLNDGHHLNNKGNDIVYKAVSDKLRELIQLENV